MTEPLVLGIDLGLSGVRAAVMDRRGKIVTSSDRQPVATRTRFGRSEQEPADWLAGVAVAAQDAMRSIESQRIEAIGVSALGPAPVLVTHDLTALTPALLFSLDTRAEKQRRDVAAQLGLTAGQLNHDHALPKLLWWREHEPARWARAAWALDATGFIVSHLTGVPTMDTITVCDYVLDGFPHAIALPPPRPPLSVAGRLGPGWAGRLGLPPGVPVLTGTYDSYADSAATGTLNVGQACIIFGSTLIIGVVHPAVPDDLHGLVVAPHLGDGVLIGGWTATGGSALGWARRLIGAGEAYDDALEEAAGRLAPGCGGLVFLPYLAGERSPVHDPDARGLLLGLTAQTTGQDVYRAVLDGIALSVRDHAQRLALIGRSPPRWRAGGGATRSRLLVQAASDALGAPVEVVADAAAPIGPCCLALRGLGYDPPVAIAAEYAPSACAGERFDRLYAVYQDLYSAVSRQMHLLTGINRSTGGRQ